MVECSEAQIPLSLLRKFAKTLSSTSSIFQNKLETIAWSFIEPAPEVEEEVKHVDALVDHDFPRRQAPVWHATL